MLDSRDCVILPWSGPCEKYSSILFRSTNSRLVVLFGKRRSVLFPPFIHVWLAIDCHLFPSFFYSIPSSTSIISLFLGWLALDDYDFSFFLLRRMPSLFVSHLGCLVFGLTTTTTSLLEVVFSGSRLSVLAFGGSFDQKLWHTASSASIRQASCAQSSTDFPFFPLSFPSAHTHTQLIFLRVLVAFSIFHSFSPHFKKDWFIPVSPSAPLLCDWLVDNLVVETVVLRDLSTCTIDLDGSFTLYQPKISIWRASGFVTERSAFFLLKLKRNGG